MNENVIKFDDFEATITVHLRKPWIFLNWLETDEETKQLRSSIRNNDTKEERPIGTYYTDEDTSHTILSRLARSAVARQFPHTWANSWPGNYCIKCGQDAPTESAICCSTCIFDYPGPNDDWATYVPKPPILCAEHQAWEDRPCAFKMVVHCMHDDYDVYCGRGKCPKTKKKGEWGNPFTIGPDGDRDEVIQKFIDLVTPQPELIARIKRELKGQVLGCWCAPKRCHCHFLAAVANS